MAHWNIRRLVLRGLLIAAITVDSAAIAAPRAEPVLTVKSDLRATSLDVRLVAPDGRVTWTCKHAGEPMKIEPCRAPSGWHSQTGTYSLLVANETPEGDDNVQDHDLNVVPGDIAVTWDTQTNEVTHTRAGDPGVHVRMNPQRLLSGDIQNDTGVPLPIGFGSETSFRAERWTNAGWTPVADLGSPYLYQPPIAPGATQSFSLRIGPWMNQDGRYRLVLGYRQEEASQPAKPKARNRPVYGDGPIGIGGLGAKRKGKDRVRLEVTGDPFEYRPGEPVACQADEDYEAFLAHQKKIDFVYRSIVSTSLGVLVSDRKGDVLQVDGPAPKTLATLAGVEILSTTDGKHVLAHGKGWFSSNDGGASFRTLPVPSDPDLKIVSAGDRFFGFRRDGTAFWIAPDGQETPAVLPVRAAWRDAEFRDARHGVLVGDCSVLAETKDGGKTWTVRVSPAAYPIRAAWDGADLVVQAEYREFLRRSGQDTFEPTVRGIQCDLQPDPQVIACRSPSHGPRPQVRSRADAAAFGRWMMTERTDLFVRRSGGAFESVPVTNPDGGRYPEFVQAKDGTLFAMYFAPSMVVRFKDGTPEIILGEAWHPPQPPNRSAP